MLLQYRNGQYKSVPAQTRGDAQIVEKLWFFNEKEKRTGATPLCGSAGSAALESGGFARAGRGCQRQRRDCLTRKFAQVYTNFLTGWYSFFSVNASVFSRKMQL